MSERGASRAREGRTRHRGSEWSPLRETRRRRRLHIWRPGRARSAHRPPGRPPQSAERPARWRRCQGRRWCSREEGRGWLRAPGGECYVGRRAPRPRARRTRRRGGAGGERGAGARVSPPPRRATAQGGGGVRVAVSPFVRRGAGPGGGQGRFVLTGRGRTVPGGVGWGGVLSALVPSPGVPHSPSAATAGDLPLAWAHRPRIKLAGPGGRRGDYARSPGGPGVRAVARDCILPGPSFMFVMVSRRPPGPRELGEAGERRPGGVGLPATRVRRANREERLVCPASCLTALALPLHSGVPPALRIPSVFTPVHLSPHTGLRQQTACARTPPCCQSHGLKHLRTQIAPPPPPLRSALDNLISKLH
ncbi:translation initiation factor IF-2-like [Peromyscus leucopus]|uniref:translation initiation factor IF-2-like n=1 Tax=Peromyscus leucopus TaxID=10041 RepID=UPI001884E447|nr:translation initiation factor IF-2-like [Peromyscus leucopus]